MNETVTITRQDAHTIQNLLDYLNQHIENMVECHTVLDPELDPVDSYRLSRDLRIRRRSEQLLIALDSALGSPPCKACKGKGGWPAPEPQENDPPDAIYAAAECPRCYGTGQEPQEAN